MFKIYSDAPTNYGKSFQDPASNNKLGIINLNNTITFYLIIIFIVVAWLTISALYSKDHLAYLSHGNLIEIIWTLLPAIILWSIGLPSLKLLYMKDEVLDAEITIKAIGNQWYWTYEYSDYISNSNEESSLINFDSFKVADDDLELGELRQITVDNYKVLPINTSIRLITTATDVLHSFCVPSLGVKKDCIPGRLNSKGFIINREATFYGACSELCGVNHGYMPIGLKAVSLSNYLSFLNSQKN